MNRKQLTLILAAVLVIGGLGLWLKSRNAASYRTTQGKMGQKVLGDFDLNAVEAVTIKHSTNEVNLAKQEDLWVVKERNSYPANFSEVSDALRKLWELKVVNSVPVGPSQLGRLELTAPGSGEKSGTLVELKDKGGKTLRTVVLGKKHTRQAQGPSAFGGEEGWPDGRYVMVGNDAQTVCLVSESFSNLEPKPEQWLNKDFFKVEKMKSVSVTYPATTNSWAASRETETGEMKLADVKPEEKIDSAKLSGIANSLSYPSFNDVVADPKPEVTGLDNPVTAVVETFENFKYTIKAGKKAADESYYMTVSVEANLPQERTPGKDEKPEDKEKLDKEFKDKQQKLADKLKQEKACEKAAYLVSKWTLDSLLKERHQLYLEKKEEGKAKDAAGAMSATSGADDTDESDEPADIVPAPIQ